MVSPTKQLYIEESEMTDYLKILQIKDKRITKITYALLNEHLEKTDNLETALKTWFDIKNEQGCERTVAILLKLRRKDLVEKYAKWVFEMKPDIGLKLFTEGIRSNIGDGVGF
jgi:hypothetical protein